MPSTINAAPAGGLRQRDTLYCSAGLSVTVSPPAAASRDVNLHRYVLNQPTGNTDPLGYNTRVGTQYVDGGICKADYEIKNLGDCIAGANDKRNRRLDKECYDCPKDGNGAPHEIPGCKDKIQKDIEFEIEVCESLFGRR